MVHHFLREGKVFVHIGFYVPASHAEKVKEAMFNAGAGKLGNYEHCSFESKGTGQFRPLAGSNPYLGEVSVLEKVEELKIEMICSKEYVKDAIKALRDHHPYETPAYYVTESLGF